MKILQQSITDAISAFSIKSIRNIFILGIIVDFVFLGYAKYIKGNVEEAIWLCVGIAIIEGLIITIIFTRHQNHISKQQLEELEE